MQELQMAYQNIVKVVRSVSLPADQHDVLRSNLDLIVKALQEYEMLKAPKEPKLELAKPKQEEK